MDQFLGCFLVILIIITITVAIVSPCGGSAIVISTIIMFLAILISNPNGVSKSLQIGTSNPINKERIISSDNPLDIDRMKEKLETKELQKETQWVEHKEVDINLENKLFKEKYKNLDNSVSINQQFNNYEEPHLTGDELIANKMAHMSTKNRNAIHNRVRFTSNNFRKYFQEELDENEDRVWWETDLLENQT